MVGMTSPLAPGSVRRIAAARFAVELNRAMTRRDVNNNRLTEAAGCASSAINLWKSGENLPRLDTAQRLAECLDWPELARIVRDGRTAACEQCGRPFVNEGGAPKRFCQYECQVVAGQLRAPTPGKGLADAIRGELRRPGALRRKPLATALEQYALVDSKRGAKVDRSARQLAVIQAAVDAMCADCEPLGVCRTPECQLRSVSPLPIALRPGKVAASPRTVEGSWGPSNRAATLAGIRKGNAERWERPDERERMATACRDRWAAMDPAERTEAGRRISAGRRHGPGIQITRPAKTA